jgi:hypothetical protein
VTATAEHERTAHSERSTQVGTATLHEEPAATVQDTHRGGGAEGPPPPPPIGRITYGPRRPDPPPPWYRLLILTTWLILGALLGHLLTGHQERP